MGLHKQYAQYLSDLACADSLGRLYRTGRTAGQAERIAAIYFTTTVR